MKNHKLKICFATSECTPFAKTGGLADVSSSLPLALSNLDCEVKIFLPLYDCINVKECNINKLRNFEDITVKIGNKTSSYNVFQGKLPESDIDVYFINCPEYFHRKFIYTNDSDEDERFILFQNAVILTLLKFKWEADIIHCNDWQTALIPAYIKNTYKESLFKNSSTVLTIHNIAYQGRFPKSSVSKANFSQRDFYSGSPYEFYDTFCFLKAGILFSDIITTVSPSYSQEIQTPEFGTGLEDILKQRKNDIYGILNGIDNKIWNPLKDKIIQYNYSADNTEIKIFNKKSLLESVNLNFDEDIPALGIVSRLAWQKGFDLLYPVIDDIMKNDIKLVILGSGEPEYENFFGNVVSKYPSKAFAYFGFHNILAHKITAGCDIFLMPSRYEPCGLNQMYCLKYGTVPIVHKTGGLADTVRDYDEFGDKANGFSFGQFSSDSLHEKISQSLNLYSNKDIWRKVMINGMTEDFSWDKSAKKYVEIYKKVLESKK